MADKGIVRQPARSTLPTPIETGHMPPCLMTMGNGFQIFLENIAPTRQEQHRPARSTAGGRPVETTNQPAARGGKISNLPILLQGTDIIRKWNHQSRHTSLIVKWTNTSL